MIIIPARGGSKRIPNKNIVQLGGRPLISYTIETCLEITPDVFVSTDSEEIAACAKNFGAQIIKRPAEISGDMATTNSVIDHFLETVSEGDYFACVQATSPLLKSKYLTLAFNEIRKPQYNSVISVAESVGFYWAKDGNPVNFLLENKRIRTQDAEKWYMENGSFYLTSRDSFYKNQNLISGKVGFVVMPKKLSFEIDDYEDLEIMEKLIKC